MVFCIASKIAIYKKKQNNVDRLEDLCDDHRLLKKADLL